jgi:hypothetical protein
MGTEASDFERDDDKRGGTGTLEAIEIEYFHWEPEGAAVSIHMHLGAIEGMARDILERLSRRPKPNVEVGGLLLGRMQPGDRAEVWIERYQRIPCAHTFGPKFVLDRDDMEGLEKAATSVLASGDLTVMGFYRSHARTGFQLEESDFELIRRYFSDPADLILLIKAQEPTELAGRFYTWDALRGPEGVGGEFPFHGRVVSSDTLPDTPETAKDAEITSISRPKPAAELRPREVLRRIVPDFAPAPDLGSAPVEPAPSLYGLSEPGLSGQGLSAPGESEQDILPAAPDDDQKEKRGAWKKWLALGAALLFAGGIGWLMLQQQSKHPAANPGSEQVAERGRPLGLYVDSSSPSWRVLWNPNATALHDARTVQLFVREGDEQTRVELAPQDLAKGSFSYKPEGNDVTFRLEVVDPAGQLSAESFRLVRQPVAAAANPAPSASAEAKPRPAPPPSTPPARFVPPKATYRAPPVVAAGIRPRIKGTLAIDVRVHIDQHGKVISASPITKQHSGLEEYLAGRAVQAARLWKFEPARENGSAVAGIQTLHFVFEK